MTNGIVAGASPSFGRAAKMGDKKVAIYAHSFIVIGSPISGIIRAI
jgi:hypothetical protein